MASVPLVGGREAEGLMESSLVAVVEEAVEGVVEGFDLFGDVVVEVEEFPSEGSVEGFDMSVALRGSWGEDMEREGKVLACLFEVGAELGAALDLGCGAGFGSGRSFGGGVWRRCPSCSRGHNLDTVPFSSSFHLASH